jgi:hypothetical protein
MLRRVWLFLISVLAAHDCMAAVSAVAPQIVEYRFAGHVDPDRVFFDGAPHGILSPWADSSVGVTGRIRYLASPNLDYYQEVVSSGPVQFQTNYYFNPGLGHSFQIELAIGDLEFSFDLAAGGEDRYGVIILIQNGTRQAADIFSDATGLTPLAAVPLYHELLVSFVDSAAPFGVFPAAQYESPIPPASFEHFTEVWGGVSVSENGETSRLAFSIDQVVLVPEPSACILALLGAAAFAIPRRRSQVA